VQQKAADGKVIGTSERTFTRNAERCFSSDEQKFRECQQRTAHLETDETLPPEVRSLWRLDHLNVRSAIAAPAFAGSVTAKRRTRGTTTEDSAESER
jgi:hypothetical protein